MTHLLPSSRPIGLVTLITAMLLACTALAANAQDLNGIFRGALQRQANNSINSAVNSAFRSITTASTGRLTEPMTTSPDAEGKVILYRTKWCGYCRKAASYMQSNNIPFVERDVDDNPGYSAEHKRLGGKGVPFMVFGDKTLSGHNEQMITQYYREMQQRQGNSPPPGQTVTEQNTPPVSGENLALRLSILNLYSAPSTTSTVLSTLTKTDQLIYLGEERDGLYRIASDTGEGWVDKRLVKGHGTP